MKDVDAKMHAWIKAGGERSVANQRSHHGCEVRAELSINSLHTAAVHTRLDAILIYLATVPPLHELLHSHKADPPPPHRRCASHLHDDVVMVILGETVRL